MRPQSVNKQAVLPWAIAFVVWPLGAFLASFKFIGQRVFSLMLVLFYFLYGYTFVIAGKEQDTFRTSQYFREAAAWSFSDLIERLSNVYSIGSKPDVFQDILQYCVSRVTDDIQIYFAVTAIIFALFAAKIFEVVYRNFKTNEHAPFFILCISGFLLLVLSPGRINSFRHYLAGVIFILTIYNYLTEGGSRHIVLLLLIPFIHFGFILVLPFVLLFKILGNRFKIYYAMVLLSFLLSAQAAQYVREYIPTLDEGAFQYHANAYTSEKYLNQVQAVRAQRYVFLDTYTYFTTLFFLGLMLFHARFLNRIDQGSQRLFAFSLVMFSFVNGFSDLESVSNRFGVLYQGLCCTFLLRYYFLNSQRGVPVYIQSIFFLVFMANAIVVIRLLIQSMSISTVMLLFPVSIISPINLSILDWIK